MNLYEFVFLHVIFINTRCHINLHIKLVCMNKKEKKCLFHIEKKYFFRSVYKYEFLLCNKLNKSQGG